jgi:hypothetical protein
VRVLVLGSMKKRTRKNITRYLRRSTQALVFVVINPPNVIVSSLGLEAKEIQSS